MIIAEAREPQHHRAVREQRGLKHIRAVVPDSAAGVRTGAAPAKNLHHLRYGLYSGQRQTGTIALIGGGREHPGARRAAEIEGVVDRAYAVDVEVHRLQRERFSRRREE
jgi:hypothetical protein